MMGTYPCPCLCWLMLTSGTQLCVVVCQENTKVKTCVARTMTTTSRPLHSVQVTSDEGCRHPDVSLQRCRRYWEVTTAHQHRNNVAQHVFTCSVYDCDNCVEVLGVKLRGGGQNVPQ